MADEFTHYDVLGLSQQATDNQIARQYRELREELMRMKVPFDDPCYEALNVAYRILSDRYLRRKYDDQIKAKGLYHDEDQINTNTPLSALFGDENEAEPREPKSSEIVLETVVSTDKKNNVDVVQLATTLENINLNPPVDEFTHYDVLGLSQQATDNQIARQYRELREELMRMKVPFDDPRYEALNVAYRILSDRYLRKRYDDELKKQNLYHDAQKIDDQTSLSDLFQGVESKVVDDEESIMEKLEPDEKGKLYLFILGFLIGYFLALFIIISLPSAKLLDTYEILIRASIGGIWGGRFSDPIWKFIQKVFKNTTLSQPNEIKPKELQVDEAHYTTENDNKDVSQNAEQ